MRIVFLGASRFGLRCFLRTVDLPDCEAVGVVTAPRTFRISYSLDGVTNVLHADLESAARARAIPACTIDSGMKDDGLFESVKAWGPEAFLVVGWYHMVPSRWRDLAPAYGLHASLLPDYSGGAPLVWAIIEGEERTGITLFELGDGVDDGPVIGQRSTPIHAHDTIATLYARIEELGLELISDFLPRIARGDAPRIRQDESRRRVFPQRSPEDGLIDWSRPARAVYDFVRAQTRPYPGAFMLLDGRRIHLWSVAPEAKTGLAPGEIEITEGVVFIGCGDGGAVRVGDATDDEGFDWLAQARAGGLQRLFCGPTLGSKR